MARSRRVRGELRVCAVTVPPSPSEEDRRRISRERATLLRERLRHTNRIRGLLFGQGITNYNPLPSQSWRSVLSRPGCPYLRYSVRAM
jgi:transposase